MLTVFGSTFLSVCANAPRLAMGADTVITDEFILLPAGRGATQALAAHLSGAKVRFASAIGMDGFGDVALASLREKKLDLSGMQRLAFPTGMSVTLQDSAGEIQRIVSLGASGVMKVDDIPEKWLDRWTTLLVQGETNETATMQAIDTVLKAEGRCILHLAPVTPISESILDRVDYLVLGEIEAIELASGFAMRTDGPRAIAYDMALRRNGPVMIVTQGLDIYIGIGGNVEHIPHPNVEIVDKSGADDALVGVFAGGISQGLPIVDVLHRAVGAAALAASRSGLQTALPEADEIDEIATNWPQDQQVAKPSLRRNPPRL